MKYPRGSAVILGIVLGFVIGVLMDNIISMTILGLMFGIIGEYANKPKKS